MIVTDHYEYYSRKYIREAVYVHHVYVCVCVYTHTPAWCIYIYIYLYILGSAEGPKTGPVASCSRYGNELLYTVYCSHAFRDRLGEYGFLYLTLFYGIS